MNVIKLLLIGTFFSIVGVIVFLRWFIKKTKDQQDHE